MEGRTAVRTLPVGEVTRGEYFWVYPVSSVNTVPDAFGPDWMIGFNVTPVVKNRIAGWVQ